VPRQRSVCSFSTVGSNRPWNHHMVNGWEFPSHVHHGDVGGSEPTQGGPTWQVGRPTLCFHVGPTNLLEDGDVRGSVDQVGAHEM